MTAGLEKLDKDRDVRAMSAEALWYDDAVLHYRYHKLKASGAEYAGWTAEDMVNLHARIVAELRRRGLPHFDRGDELDRDTKPFLKEYAEVRPSGVKAGEPVTLEDVLPHIKSFKLRQPYAYLVGGLAVHGRTEGDVDVLIKDSPALPPEFRHVLEWRILRSLPEKLALRVQFHYDRFHGPFTNNVPLFDLTVERVNPENRVFRMDAEPGEIDLVKGLAREELPAFLAWAEERGKEAPRAGTPETGRQAEASRAEDRIEPFRFFLPMKPTRGYFPEERQTIERFLSLFGPEDFPVHSTKKYDGANYEVHKSGERVAFWSEDGEENTERFPALAAAVRALPWREMVILAEIEAWRDGRHLPREAVTGYVHAKGEPDDSELVANVYDVVYAAGGPKEAGVAPDAGDIHKLPFAERENYLAALGIGQATFDAPDLKKKLNRAPSVISRNLEELRAHTEDLAARPGSEGNVAKKAAGAYSLSGRAGAQIKFHNSAILAGVVIERIETKVAGTFNYRYALAPGKDPIHADAAVDLGGETHLEVGKTFSTARRAEPGAIIEVEFETLNLVHYPDKTVSVTAWAPRAMRVLEGRMAPDAVDEAVEAAKAGRVFQEKEVTEAGETLYKDAFPPASSLQPQVFDKANYVGNKRRLAKYIVGKFPEEAGTVFDCMCGVSGVLIEAARRGWRVRGNDLSVVPYWYSKGVFEGAPLSEADAGKLVRAPLHEGWLATEWKGVYPRPGQVRRFLDGLARRAREWRGPKGLAARAVASRVLQTLYSDSISGYSTRRYESLDAVRAVVGRAVKEVSDLAAEVAGRGRITSEDAKRMRFPRADVVYFDPPFFKRDKGYVHYFQTYRIMNSILLGRAWQEENLAPEDVPPILKRLCAGCGRIFISTSSNEVVPYARELARRKRTMKRYRVSYTQTSGFGSRDSRQHEHLYVGKALADPADPYMRLPDEEKKLRYVVQAHHRGRSVHDDFRLELEPGGELVGWTLNTQIPGSIKEPVTTLTQARALEFDNYSKIDWGTGEFAQRRKEGSKELVNASIVCERKALEPAAWLTVEGVVEPGGVGATSRFPGVFRIVDQGTVEFLSQKPWFHEYRPHSDRKTGGFGYRILFRQLRVADIKREDEEKALSPELIKEYLARDPGVEREDWDLGYREFLKAEGGIALPAAETKFREEAAWLLIKPIDQTPYALSDRAVEDGWVPPKGSSALPEAVRSKVPAEYRYWQMERESERCAMRDALVEAVGAGEVALPGVEKAAPAGDGEFEKRKLVPFNQWGGSAIYASRLAKRLPDHERYVEPFCGSAALFFAKERVAEEVLADIDPEVVFALKHVQRLTPQAFEALKRLNWTVSRAGFKRAKACEPKSDAERFWKLVYGRLCSWGGIGGTSGYSTVHDGHTYKLEDLWRFRERLRGARIVRRDWRETLKACDGAGALFFLDPPYVEEWATGKGIAPEEIADAVRKLKGEFVVAYTDSARARRALAKAGRLFTMKLQEARHRGLWAKRSRLFVASFDVRKADDLDRIEAAAGGARFVLQYHYFRKRGEKPVRAGPTTWHWDLRLDAGEETLRHWVLDHDITQAAETVGYFKRDADRRAFDAEGFYPPGSFMNPTKDTPAFVEVVDRGECRLLVDQPGLVKLEFRGKKLRGVWLLEKKDSNWHVRRVEAAPRAESQAAPAGKREAALCSR